MLYISIYYSHFMNFSLACAILAFFLLILAILAILSYCANASDIFRLWIFYEILLVV